MTDMFPQYSTKLMGEIFPDERSFVDGWKSCGLYRSGYVTDDRIALTYHLLSAAYGNNPIANLDENQFRLKVYSTVFKFAPSWEKRLDIQEKVRALTDDELADGGKSISNHATNPSIEPSTATLEELDYIDDQSTSSNRRSKLDGFAMQWSILETDVTEAYVDRFRHCFKTMVMPERPTLYATEDLL